MSRAALICVMCVMSLALGCVEQERVEQAPSNPQHDGLAVIEPVSQAQLDELQALEAQELREEGEDLELERMGDPVPFELGSATESSGQLVAPDRAWSFITLPESRCANDEPTGIGLNPSASSDELMVYFEGGGACWNAATCGIGTAANLRKGYDAADFAKDKIRGWSIFARDEAKNPFREMTQVIVPYCTGDVHAGTKAVTYRAGLLSQEIKHHGALNVEAMLTRLVATYPNTRRIVLVGTSAGGFGAQLNYPKFVAAFPQAQIDLIADGAQLVNPRGGLVNTWVNTWGIELPTDCPSCAQNFPDYVDYLLQKHPSARFGLIGSMRDTTLTPFFNFGVNLQAFRDETAALLVNSYDPNPNARYFIRSGLRHGYLNKVVKVTSRRNKETFEWMSDFVDGVAVNKRP